MTSPLAVPLLDFGHLDFGHLMSMTDQRGTFEHALFDKPRPEHGYCSDDMARVLVVACREQGNPEAESLALLSVRFLYAALDTYGKSRNRMDQNGAWEDLPSVDDCWGRSIWGLATAATRSGNQLIRDVSTAAIDRAMRQRSPWPRATAFATLGAADILKADPDNSSARFLLSDAVDVMAGTRGHGGWPWPEPRLTYANPILPEAMIAAGSALDQPALVRRGLDLLEWLLLRQTQRGHLSVTPAGGSGPDDHGPGFDQQPIEVAALADACARAFDLDGNRQWIEGITAATGWFLGHNDGAIPMWDPETGGGYDGLQRIGANLNQGTESTLALLSTMQHARRLASVP